MISSYETFGGQGRSTRDQRPFGDDLMVGRTRLSRCGSWSRALKQ
jgi:hypothetical protein